ncbi:vWA domain-containing protein [Sphingosinicella microcystinivorans]|uniref:Ribonucleoprotein n=1 Tax=Sphingosinicella microcystinivorans TaxID=335406 RepID=A0AAD1G0W5_SPHMI|nr:RNA-binding protein [Sphingosinicella microcystinivorans]RKS91346.1 60 kDa SS-A/Ro ribonucleoprotein [Sphingosinicella microcystinivorans]BBE34317.1 ribonucleoprotein [Sphingosinicella microcystinivorans]
MANKGLFASAVAKLLPRTDTLNREGAPAYAYRPKAKLAQLAATGTLADNFYGAAETQLADVLDAARVVDPYFVAQTAIYARTSGAMKDMPALLAAYLTVADPDLAVRVFGQVVNSGRMLRSFVQIMRSGQVGRTSLGTRPKRLVQQWLEQASMRDLMQAATGNAPSLADIVKMVHPRPADAQRKAFYGWLIGRPYDVTALPAEIAAFETWKQDRTLPLPQVPFEWLTAYPLGAEQWAELAGRMGWQALRMNLNALARAGAFGVEGFTEKVAGRLADRNALLAVRPMPYQLMLALGQVSDGVPLKVHAALEDALELSLRSVPQVPGRVVVCPDVSGSMKSPVTGYRRGASSKVRCIDVAALVTAAMLRSNGQARVIPFEQAIVPVMLRATDRVAVNAATLAAVGGGGTNVSAPLALLNKEKAAVDLVIIVSDNESWVDATRGGSTATMQEWTKLAKRNPQAKLVCIDIAPYGTTQAASRRDILNVGGFSDAVFVTIARFVSGETHDWVSIVEQVEV